MDDKERAAWETMKSWQEARDKHKPGSKEYQIADQEYKKAEAEYHKARK